jgi:phospholipid/cholesterol/gamma-HCH transport system permease protein
MDQLLGAAGRKTFYAFNHISKLFALTCHMLRLIVFRPKEGRVVVKRIVLEQIYFTAVQALPIIVPIALIFGSMIIIQFSRFTGQLNLGRITVLIILRELGPVITAFLIILRSATAVTIEISYMNVFHEMDALEMLGVDPYWVVFVPRMIGITTAVLCLFIVFDIVAILGGYAVVWMITYIYMGDYLIQIANAISGADIVVGIIKAVLFGITITVTCLYHGLSTRAHITQIPVATSHASVQCFVYCILINVFISTLFYL